MTTRLKPNTNPEKLIDNNLVLIKKYLIEDRASLQKAEEIFKSLFKEFSEVNHNDSFHGNETLLYHQYMVLHCFNKFMDVVVKDLSEDDLFVKSMEQLLETIETKTKLGRKELKQLLTQTPPTCSKNLQTLLFLTVLFHDIGKLYNTGKWEQEFNDETLKLRKFQRHDDYGWSFLQIISTKKVHFERLFTSISTRIKSDVGSPLSL